MTKDNPASGSQVVHFTMVGLGRMGVNIVKRIKQKYHVSGSDQILSIHVYDIDAEVVTSLSASEGFKGLYNLSELTDLNKSNQPQVVWIMVPAAVTAATIQEVAQYLAPGSIIIDGGNSFYRDDIANAAWLAEKKIHFIDVGTSGGVYGLERGYSLMIGGDDDVVNFLSPIFQALAPGVESAERTPGLSGAIISAEYGYYHCGPVGSGHFVKMVHNGIEYGAMAAYAEGLNLLHAAANGISHPTSVGGVSETKYELNMAEITQVWRRGSVVASWLLDLTAQAYVEDSELATYTGAVADSGEGRWTVQTAIDAGVPANVLSASLMGRFSSRGNDLYTNKVLSAMRKKFGGHTEAKRNS